MRAEQGEGTEGPVAAALGRLVAEGVLRPDPAQQRAARVLDRIDVDLRRPGAAWWSRWLTSRGGAPVIGAYLVGEVGRGKTMLMDLFFEQVTTERKRRVHYHEFMDEMHEAIAAFRRRNKGRAEDADPVAAVARPLARDLDLLCLDEFHVNDITNAMLLGRLFEQLFAGGVVLVATSNVAPDRLYENGLNRALFTPFIAVLKRRTELVDLNGQTDYRRLKFGTRQCSNSVRPGRWGRRWRRCGCG